MQNVAIFGVGLIGGSFALALRKAGFTGKITGVSSPITLSKALERGIIDAAADPEAAADEADFIYLSQPILGIISTLERFGPRFHPRAVVTDAGSTKFAIVEAARKHVRHALFIGGHPMAGKEVSGVEHSDPDLFQTRKYALTPLTPEDTRDTRFTSLVGWVKAIGAAPVLLNSEYHDRLVAFTSHAPQLISTALAGVLSELPDPETLAGPAVLELTRLAVSPFEIWSDILATNAGHISDALTAIIDRLSALRPLVGCEQMSAEFSKGAEGAKKLRSRPEY